ncbi:MAG: hypothetical protein WC614_04105 [bacterium]
MRTKATPQSKAKSHTSRLFIILLIQLRGKSPHIVVSICPCGYLGHTDLYDDVTICWVWVLGY